jgi:hypothetical protein
MMSDIVERLSDDRVATILRQCMAGYSEETELSSLCREVMERRKQDALNAAYREVAEAAIVWQVAGIVAWDSFDRAMSRHYPAIHAAMEEGDE